MELTKKQLIGGIAGVAAGLILAFMAPPEGLTPQGMICAGLVVGSLIWMIFGTAKEFVVMMITYGLFIVTGCCTFTRGMGAFAGTTWWITLTALIVGVVFAKSGLLNRLTLNILKRFPVTLKGQMIGITAAGVIVSPLIPSGTARLAIAGPLVKDMSDNIGYEHGSKGANALFSAFYTGWNLTSHMFLSASFNCYQIIGFMPEGYEISWTRWLTISLPWSIVVLVLTTLFCYKYYNPKDGKDLDKRYIVEKLEKLGSWGRGEKITMILLIVALVFWITESYHGIAAATVTLFVAGLLMLFKVITPKEMSDGLPMDLLIYFGLLAQFGGIMGDNGLNDFISSKIGPILTPMMNSPWLFLPFLCVLVMALRLVINSWVTTYTIFGVLLVPLCVSAGIHPFVAMFTVYVAIGVFYAKWQNLPYITALAVADGLTTHEKTIPYAVIYCITCFIGIAVCIPYWMMLGLI